MTPLRRRFVPVGNRRVHYLRRGEGPPVVLLHSAPANAWRLLPEIELLAKDYTVFAFDLPGFGLSDPLPLPRMHVADLAAAMAESLLALEMPACPVFGTHSGAAVALELGARHPERVTGLVLDGVPAFTAEECSRLFDGYFARIPITDLGGQYALGWTRFRDQSIWFPWNSRRPEHLNEYDLSPPESTNLWLMMYFQAADTYEPAYRATSHYGADASTAAAALEVPAIFTACGTDMLYPHLSRLPPLKPGQEIRRVGASYHNVRRLIQEGFARFGSGGSAPADQVGLDASSRIARQFVDIGNTRQLHLRYAGARAASPLLVLHDAPGSSASLEALIERMAGDHFVLAPDLAGCGDSARLPEGARALTDFAADILALLDALDVGPVTLCGVGFGSSVAVEIARVAPARVSSLQLSGLLLPDAAERDRLRNRYAPPIGIEPDGSHWYRCWLMLRDSLLWWPWFDRRRETLLRKPADLSAERLHRWTLEVVRRHDSYSDLIAAAIDHDAAAALVEVRVPVTASRAQDTPLHVYADRLEPLATTRPRA